VVRFAISHADHEPLGIAGIWEYRSDGPNGLPLISFSMLTINADDHPLMRRFHKPNDEKRMVVILRPSNYDAWLDCSLDDVPSFFTPYPADELIAVAAPKESKSASQASLLDNG
jgi:putative SOS response-associated peptidase YedK